MQRLAAELHFDLVSVIAGSQEPSVSSLFEDDCLNLSPLTHSLYLLSLMAVELRLDQWTGAPPLPLPLSPPTSQMVQGCTEIS